MDIAYLSALSALSGSAIGAFSSITTTWLTQHSQSRAQREAAEMQRREGLYQSFIDESSKLFIHAMTHDLADPSALVAIYAMICKLRLFTSAEIVANANQVMELIVETYYRPNADFSKRENLQKSGLDILEPFSLACRNDLRR